MRVLTAALCVAACALIQGKAEASDFDLRNTIDWTSVVDSGARYFDAMKKKALHPTRPALFDIPAGAPLIGSDLRFALLGRTRGGTFPILGGDQRSAVDLAGVRRTTTEIVERVVLAGGIVQPFVQFGAGMWRKDDDRRLMMAGDRWYGGQVGAGIQIPPLRRRGDIAGV